MLARITAAAGAVKTNRFGPRIGVLAAACLVLLLALGSAPALAGYTHVYSGEFGSPTEWPPAPGMFSGNAGVAVDSANGNLFVADEFNSRVQQFTEGGAPVSMWSNLWFGVFGVAVDAAHERVYVTEQWSNAVEVFNLPGVSQGQLQTGTGWGSVNSVAVDTGNGDVYVSDQANNLVQVFDSTGTHLGSFGTAGSGPGEFSGPTSVAVDPSSHDVYVVDSGNGRVEEFSKEGASYLGSLAGVSSPLAVAVDGSNGDVFVGESTESLQVARYDSAGNRLYAFGSTSSWMGPGSRFKSIAGIAVNPSTHTVYVSDSADSAIKIFAAAPVPSAVTGEATNVTAHSATLEGAVNPEGETVIYEYFQLGADTGYSTGNAYGNQYSLTGNAEYAVSSETLKWLGNLQPNMTYHYRLVAVGPNGKGYGQDRAFTTLPAPPVVDGSFAVASPETVVLHAQINPENSATSYSFEYGQTSSYGSASAAGVTGAVYGDQDSSLEIVGLAPDTVYHYRVVADNGTGGVQYGPDVTFKTAPAAMPVASEVTVVSASLEGVVDVRGSGSYRFEYGPSSAYGMASAEAPAAPVSGDQTVSAKVEGLTPGVTYHFRVVANLSGETMVSADGTFTTLAPAAVITGAPTGVGSEGAMLHGTLETHGQPAAYRFIVTGVGNPVQRVTPDQAYAGEGTGEVSAALTELPSGGEYEVVLSATVGGMTSYGEPVRFTTPARERLLARTPAPEGNPYAGLPSGQPAGGPTGTSSSPQGGLVLLWSTAKGTAATVAVRIRAAGTLAVNGAGLRPGARTVGNAGVYRLSVRLTRAAARKLRRKSRLAVPFSVNFTPASGPPSQRRGVLVFARKAAHR